MKSKQISFLAIAFFLHCAVSGKGEVLDPAREVPSQGDLPVKTIEYEIDKDGAYQFYTNDNNKKLFGYYYTVPGTAQTPFSTIEIRAKKKSGVTNNGYGMIYGYQDSKNYCIFQISPNGFYKVRKYLNGSEVTPVPIDWTTNNSIVNGLNNYNTLTVVYSATAPNYTFSINGKQVATSNTASCPNGSMGFWTVVDADDDFPNTPVDARYYKVAP